MGIKLTGARRLQRKLKAKQRAMEREAAGALGEAASELESDIKSRVFPAKRVSQQDAPAGRAISLSGRSPVQTKIQRAQRTATVKVQRHWTPARTPAIRAIVGPRGLERRGLYVQDLTTFTFRFVSFREEPNLLRWARRPDKGRQYLRHVVRLRKPEWIRQIAVSPGAREAFPKITRIWLRITRRTFRS